MAIDRTPRRNVAPTIVSGPGTIVDVAGDSPVLSGADLDFYDDSGEAYILRTSQALGAGGQGTVVLADRASDGRTYAAKISWQAQSARDRMSRRAVITFLRNLTATHPLGERHFTETHLMPIVASGSITDTVPELGSTTYDVAIMPVCSDALSSRTDVSFEEIRDVILPQTAQALHLLHEHRIVHRDIKPKNLYYLENQLVVGDFGISSVLDEGRDTGTTKIDRRTPGYSPHSSVIQRENDWYSLGYTIWTLYNGGVHPHQALIDADDLSAVLVGKRPVAFVAKRPEHECLGKLIYGLTRASSVDRMGYDDVQRWLDDPQGFTYTESAQPAPRAGYQFEGTLYTDYTKLADALSANWERGKRHLYTKLLENFFRTHGENDLAVALNDIVEVDRATVKNHDLGLSRAISVIGGDFSTYHWHGTAFGLMGFRAAHDNGRLSREELLAFVQTGQLSWNAQRAGADPRILDVLHRLEEAASDNEDFAVEAALQMLSPQGASLEGCTTPDQLFAWLCRTPAGFYRRIDDTALLHRIAGFNAACGRFAQSLEFDRSIENGAEAVANNVLVLFEKSCANPAAVRKFYELYGPYGHVTWVCRHADYYTATDDDSRALLRKLSGAKTAVTSIENAIQKLGALQTDVIKLQSSLADNPYLAYLGIDQPGLTIKANYSDSYFTGYFAGSEVPRGYARAVADASTAEPAFASALRSDGVERLPSHHANDARDVVERVAGDLKTASQNQRSGRAFFKPVLKILLTVAFVLVIGMFWGYLPIGIPQMNDYFLFYLAEDVFDGLRFAPTTYTSLALIGFLTATGASMAPRVARLVRHVTANATSARIEHLSQRVESEASRFNTNNDALRAWWEKGNPGPIPRICEASRQLERAEENSTGSANSKFCNVLYWVGTATCALSMLAFTMHGSTTAIAHSTTVGGIIPADILQIANVVVALAAYALLARFLPSSKGFPSVCLLCAAPFAMAAVFLFTQLVIALLPVIILLLIILYFLGR
ncbi:protein kinase family protein [Slackia heliotrinireducens]|uniref:protein kinase family protein n=1 Tax=Slackia heliotrinireducens TaxID=84110 RepID=UPI003314D018